MKKLLMVTTAIAGVAFMSAPASAAIDLNVGGYFSGYVADTDIDGVNNAYDTDFRRDTRLNVSGETVLDNGLTVGAYSEMQIADSSNANSVEAKEMYAYFQNAMGRVNFGEEDGAAYLLQVAAPSADSNVDGLDPTISAIGAMGSYAHIDFRDTDRLTYLSPKVEGFQFGGSYAAKPGVASDTAVNNDADNDGEGVINAGAYTAADYKDPYELAVRYDGEYQGFGISAGAGWSVAEPEVTTAIDYTGAAGTNSLWVSDDANTYNAGLNVAYQGFSLGVAYKMIATEVSADVNAAAAASTIVTRDWDNETYVIGGSYDFGPYHVGASYLTGTEEVNSIDSAATDINGYEVETERYTIGGGYSFGPGMTFRGAVAWGDQDISEKTVAGARDIFDVDAGKTDFTQVTVGTDIKF